MRSVLQQTTGHRVLVMAVSPDVMARCAVGSETQKRSHHGADLGRSRLNPICLLVLEKGKPDQA